jgi:hypothetical protein
VTAKNRNAAVERRLVTKGKWWGVVETSELTLTNPIRTLEGQNSLFIVVVWTVITKVTVEVRCGDE